MSRPLQKQTLDDAEDTNDEVVDTPVADEALNPVAFRCAPRSKEKRTKQTVEGQEELLEFWLEVACAARGRLCELGLHRLDSGWHCHNSRHSKRNRWNKTITEIASFISHGRDRNVA